MEGEVRYKSTFDTINVSGQNFSIKNLPKDLQKSIKQGDWVTVYYEEKNQFFAKNIIIRSVNQKYKNGKETKPEKPEDWMKPKKTVDEYVALIKDMEPFIPQEMLDVLSDEDRTYLLEMMKGSVGDAIKLYDITATFEDTKKDIEEIASVVLEVAFCMTVILDTNTKQILKRNLPVEKEEKKK